MQPIVYVQKIVAIRKPIVFTMKFAKVCVRNIRFFTFQLLFPFSIRNFCSLGHKPKIRFRYAEEKAKIAGEQPAVKMNEKMVSLLSRESVKPTQPRIDRKTSRLEKAPKRMSVSKEEMEVVQLGGARP